MFCIILKHHSWEPEVEVIHSLIVLFILLRIIEVGIEAISLRPQCRYDTIRCLVRHQTQSNVRVVCPRRRVRRGLLISRRASRLAGMLCLHAPRRRAASHTHARTHVERPPSMTRSRSADRDTSTPWLRGSLVSYSLHFDVFTSRSQDEVDAAAGRAADAGVE